MVEFKIKSLDEYKKVLDYIIKKKSKIILFNGDLGSGKTTLIQLICKKLNVKENILSPTFNLINEYRSEENIKIYHFDLYRINSIQDLIDIDSFSEGNNLTLLVHHSDGTKEKIICNHTYNETQIDWFRAGSALNLIRLQN